MRVRGPKRKFGDKRMKTRAMTAALIVLVAYAIRGRTIAQVMPVRGAAHPEFIGMWRLISIGTIRPNGEVVTDWMGPNPSGTLIYDQAGHVSVQIMHDPRTTWKVAGETAAEDVADASTADNAAAFDGYYAYYGRYEVRENDKVVRHYIESSLWPPEVGTTYERHFEFAGDRLTLTTTGFKVKGEQRYNQLVFKRVM